MSSDKITLIKEKLAKASRKFLYASRSSNKKFMFLPDWVLSESAYFYDEANNRRDNFKVYPRGALVFLDFGVNVGRELSGNHFGIVLNKSDSPRNGVLTVVPVSSKSNKFSVELDGLISEKSLDYLEDSADQLASKIHKTDDAVELHRLKTEAEKINRVVETYLRFNKISYAKCLDVRTISKKRILKINKYDPVGKITVSNSTLNNIDRVIIANFTNSNLDTTK